MVIKKIGGLFLLVFGLSGCISFSIKSTKTAGGRFESFYLGNSLNQYFVKPIRFSASNNTKLAELDITFRIRDSILKTDSATVNFSVISDEKDTRPDSICLTGANDAKVLSKKVNPLFVERKGKKVLSRYTTNLPLQELKKTFLEEPISFIVYSQAKQEKYMSDRKARKAVTRLNKALFSIL